ncbi:MAG: hypothetical protein R2815_13950 [Flavobacteriales bacterium]
MRFAKVLSVVLHPIFMPLYTLALAFRLDPYLAFFMPQEARWITLGMVGLMTIAFPITSTLLLLRAGMISSLEMPLRRERIGPYVMTLLYYGMTWYLVRQAPLHPSVNGLFLGVMVALVLTTVITVRWKISAHMVGIGGLLGALCGLSAIHGLPLFMVLVAAILITGLLATARLLVGGHTPAQVYTGTALGFLSPYACLVLGLGA